MIPVVRREAFRSAEEFADAGFLQDRQAFHRAFQNRHEMVHVAGQLVETEIVGDGRHVHRNGVRLERAEQNFSGIFLVVGTAALIAQHRQVARQAFNRVGQNIIVLAGMQRHRNAGHQADIPRPQPGAVDHEIGLDIALVGGHAGDLAVGLVNIRHLDVFDDGRTAHARALGHRHRHVDRVGLAVLRQEDAADKIVRVCQRVHRLDVGRGQDIDIQTENLSHRCAALQFLEAFIVCGDGKTAILLETCRLPGFGFQPGEQFGRVLCEFRQILGGAELADQAGGVPGRAAGQLLAFQQHDIRPAEFGQVIGEGTSHRATTDDDNLCFTWQSRGHRTVLPHNK